MDGELWRSWRGNKSIASVHFAQQVCRSIPKDRFEHFAERQVKANPNDLRLLKFEFKDGKTLNMISFLLECFPTLKEVYNIPTSNEFKEKRFSFTSINSEDFIKLANYCLYQEPIKFSTIQSAFSLLSATDFLQFHSFDSIAWGLFEKSVDIQRENDQFLETNERGISIEFLSIVLDWYAFIQTFEPSLRENIEQSFLLILNDALNDYFAEILPSRTSKKSNRKKLTLDEFIEVLQKRRLDKFYTSSGRYAKVFKYISTLPLKTIFIGGMSEQSLYYLSLISELETICTNSVNGKSIYNAIKELKNLKVIQCSSSILQEQLKEAWQDNPPEIIIHYPIRLYSPH